MALPVDTCSPDAEQVQLELLRRAGTARRAALALRLSTEVLRLARRAIETRHPDWSRAEVDVELVRVHYGDALAEKLRAHLARAGL